MIKQLNVGDLVEGGFGLLHHDYGLGIIIQKKRFAPQVYAYQIHWSNHNTTWEPVKQLTLVAKNELQQ
jgi:hypothetical protein